MYNITLFIPDYGRNVEPMDSCFSFLKVFSGCWPLGLSIFFNKWDRASIPTKTYSSRPGVRPTNRPDQRRVTISPVPLQRYGLNPESHRRNPHHFGGKIDSSSAGVSLEPVQRFTIFFTIRPSRFPKDSQPNRRL